MYPNTYILPFYVSISLPMSIYLLLRKALKWILITVDHRNISQQCVLSQIICHLFPHTQQCVFTTMCIDIHIYQIIKSYTFSIYNKGEKRWKTRFIHGSVHIVSTVVIVIIPQAMAIRRCEALGCDHLAASREASQRVRTAQKTVKFKSQRTEPKDMIRVSGLSPAWSQPYPYTFKDMSWWSPFLMQAT